VTAVNPHPALDTDVGWLDCDDAEALAQAALAPPWWAKRGGSLPGGNLATCSRHARSAANQFAPRLVEVAQGLLLDDHAALGQPRECRSGLGELSGLLHIPRCRTAGLPPTAARPPGSTRTGRARSG
jgi:hypothetical protein